MKTLLDILRANDNATSIEILRFLFTFAAMVLSVWAFSDYIRWYRQAGKSSDPNAKPMMSISLRVEGLIFTLAFMLCSFAILSMLAPTPSYRTPYGAQTVFSNLIQLFMSIIIIVVKVLNRLSLNQVKKNMEDYDARL